MRTLIVASFAVGALAFMLKFLPGFLAGGLADAVAGSNAPAAVPSQTPTPKPAPSSASAKQSKTPAAAPATQPAVPVSRCAGLSAAQVGKIIGRTVHPIAKTGSCAWGERLDDARTTLVEVRTMTKHPAYEGTFVTSASQRRTVFGAAYLNYTSGTALWVAAGQPIGIGKKPVNARLAIHVAVATKELKVSDDRARDLTTSIAMSVNAAK